VGKALAFVARVVDHDFGFDGKEQARKAMTTLTALFRDWNLTSDHNEDYPRLWAEMEQMLASSGRGAPSGVAHA